MNILDALHEIKTNTKIYNCTDIHSSKPIMAVLSKNATAMDVAKNSFDYRVILYDI